MIFLQSHKPLSAFLKAANKLTDCLHYFGFHPNKHTIREIKNYLLILVYFSNRKKQSVLKRLESFLCCNNKLSNTCYCIIIYSNMVRYSWTHDVKPYATLLLYFLFDCVYSPFCNGTVFNTFDLLTPGLTASPLWPSQLPAGAATDTYTTALLWHSVRC